MKQLIAEFSEGDEYELRCLFPIQTIQEIYGQVSKTGTLEKTFQIDVIKPIGRNAKIRKEMYFKKVKGKLKLYNTVYMNKVQKGTYIEDINALKIKHVLSSEVIVDPIPIPCARGIVFMLKFRERYIIGEWAWDFTIQIIRDSANVAHNDISNMLIDPDADFWDEYKKAQVIPQNKLILEVEYVGGKQITHTQIFDTVGMISKYLNITGQGESNYARVLDLIFPFLSERIKAKSLSHLVNKPISLDRTTYTGVYVDITNYYLTDKTDGERCLIILDQSSYYMTAVESNSIDFQSDKIIILDSEKVKDTFMVFDCLRIGDDRCIFDSFETRWSKLSGLKLPDGMILKDMVRITSPDIIPEFYHRARDYNIDGLIFTPALRNSFIATKDSLPNAYYDCAVYKWKPPKQLTIDFLIKKPDKKYVNTYPMMEKPDTTLYVLCTGISKNLKYKFKLFNIFNMIESYGPIPFQPCINSNVYVFHSSDADLDGMVGEFCVVDGQFQLCKIRYDKTLESRSLVSFGNDYRIADITYFNCLNPLQLEDLSSFEVGYFQSEKPKEYNNITRFHGNVKRILIRTYVSKAGYVIDLASGKGQDLYKYNESRVSALLCCDVDMDALEELNRRKYKIKFPMKLTIRRVDLKSPEAFSILNVEKFQANGILINFAIHYVIVDEESAHNFVELISKLLQSSGHFIVTCFDGGRVNELLELDPDWDNEKFSIRKKYDQYKFSNLISVRHHFADYYDEYLLNLEALIKLFKKSGLNLVDSKYFDEMPGSSSLSPEDFQYTRLYRSLVFKKL